VGGVEVAESTGGSFRMNMGVEAVERVGALLVEAAVRIAALNFDAAHACVGLGAWYEKVVHPQQYNSCERRWLSSMKTKVVSLSGRIRSMDP